MSEARRLRRIYRKRELPAVTGLQHSRIDELIALGEFPAPIKLSDGGRVNGWLEDELIDWQEMRAAKRDQPQPRIIRARRTA